MDNIVFNESWFYLGGRKFNNRETGEYLGLEVWLQNSSNQPPIKATCMCVEEAADKILKFCALYRPINKVAFSVRWSSRKRKWYLFVDDVDAIGVNV